MDDAARGSDLNGEVTVRRAGVLGLRVYPGTVFLTGVVLLAGVLWLMGSPLVCADPAPPTQDLTTDVADRAYELRPRSRPTSAPRASGRPRHLVTATFDHGTVLESDFDNSLGSFSLSYQGLKLTTGLPVAPRTILGIELAHRYTRFDFDDFSLGGTGEPFEESHTTSLGLVVRRPINDQWSAMVIASLKSSREEGASLKESLHPSMFASGRYRWSDDFAVTFGVVGSYDLLDELRVFPIIGIDWQVTDRVTVATRDGLSATYLIAPEEGVTVGLNVSFAGTAGGGQFRLKRGGPSAGGVADLKYSKIALMTRWAPQDSRIQLGGELGFVSGYELEIENRRGHRVFKEDLDSALFLGLSATVGF